jgi:hypothetical protein
VGFAVATEKQKCLNYSKDCFPMPHLWCNNSPLLKTEGGEPSLQVEFMWIKKLLNGVVELETPIGPRYIEPNLTERAYLMWTFRNFFSLPQQVLRPWERRLIDRLRSENRFVSVPSISASEVPIIGRIERRAPVPAEVVSMRQSSSRESLMNESSLRKPVSGSKTAAVEDGREAASA